MSSRSTPWVLPGQAIVTMRPGEDPERIPSHRDVVEGFSVASTSLDGGKLDRVLRRFSPAAQVTRQFQSARGLNHPGERHQRWDDLEQELGLSRTFRVHVAQGASTQHLLEELRSLSTVQAASAHYLAHVPFDAAPIRPFHNVNIWSCHDQVGAGRANLMEPGDPAVIVAVIDSGVLLSHPEFVQRLRPGMDLVDLSTEQMEPGLRLFGDVRGRDRTPLDEMGHGTACAGIIGARGQHVAPGLAGAASILPIRALAAARIAGRDKPTAIGGLADIDAAIKTAVDLHARVLNLSFGTPSSIVDELEPRPHEAVTRYALRRGCTMVAASGNRAGFHEYFPAALPQVISVGSVDLQGRPSEFMSRGEHVDLCAPGEDVPCVALDGYAMMTGTSFASPFVAAACALLIARAARYSTPLDADSIRRLLVESAAPFADGSDPQGSGAGILDVPAALSAVDTQLAWSEASGHELSALAG